MHRIAPKKKLSLNCFGFTKLLFLPVYKSKTIIHSIWQNKNNKNKKDIDNAYWNRYHNRCKVITILPSNQFSFSLMPEGAKPKEYFGLALSLIILSKLLWQHPFGCLIIIQIIKWLTKKIGWLNISWLSILFVKGWGYKWRVMKF